MNLSKGKYRGSERLLRTALGYLRPYRTTGALGFDIEAVCAATEAVYASLLAAGEAGIGGVDLGGRPFYAFDGALLREHAIRDRVWGFDRQGQPLGMEITVAQ